jgi:hypothetical protein
LYAELLVESRPPPPLGVCDGDGSSDLLPPPKLITEDGVGVADVVVFELAESGRWKPVKV